MRHVDPDTLALLALGERVADSEDRAHLHECAECAAELSNFSRAVNAGRSTIDAGQLLSPAPRVWNRIADELELQPTEAPAPVVHLAPRRRRWMPVLAVAASLAVVASAGVVVWQFAQPSAPTVLASATLEAFPNWPDATGDAVVEKGATGSRVVRVTVDSAAVGQEFTEVWLISSDTTRLVSLGTLEGTSGTFTIPTGIDLSIYDLVDVSAEPYDGDPTHSGDSIVRGQLT